MLCLVVLPGLVLMPAPGVAQDSWTAGETTRRFAADHSGHAELHRVGPSAAAIEIIAMETLVPLHRDARALCEAARLALTAGLLSEGEEERLYWYGVGSQYAHQAARLAPASTDALFMIAASLGLEAPHQPLRQRIRTADRIQELSERILAANPNHPGGLHLRGSLGAAAMRLSPVTRFMVEKVMGSDVVGTSSWEAAERDFRAALAVEPENPSHRIELALLLRDTGRVDEAREQLRLALDAPGRDPLIEHYRQRARELLGPL